MLAALDPHRPVMKPVTLVAVQKWLWHTCLSLFTPAVIVSINPAEAIRYPRQELLWLTALWTLDAWYYSQILQITVLVLQSLTKGASIEILLRFTEKPSRVSFLHITFQKKKNLSLITIHFHPSLYCGCTPVRSVIPCLGLCPQPLLVLAPVSFWFES